MLTIFIMPLPGLLAQAPSFEVVFEQRALKFFLDSVLNKMKPFTGLKASLLDGWILLLPQCRMSSLSFMPMIRCFEFYKVQTGKALFWRTNKKPAFLLQVNKPVKHKVRDKYRYKSKIIRLMVFQERQVGEKHFVWIRTFTKDGYTGFDFYFVIK